MDNQLSRPVALVSTQYVEPYSDDPKTPYYKFKGGSYYLVQTSLEATAIGVVLKHLNDRGFSAGSYPTTVSLFSCVENAVASLEEWERDGVTQLGSFTEVSQ
jgi:hypothetical protein